MNLVRCALPMLALVAGPLLAACGPEQGVVEFDDTRIDGGSSFSPEPRSHDPRLCVSGSNVYAAWWDAREGRDNVYLNVSTDQGGTWLDEPIRVNQNPDMAWSARHPEVACNQHDVFVVWQDDRLSDIENPAVYYNFSQDAGASWQTQDIPLTHNDGDWASLAPQLALSCTATEPVVCAHLAVTWYDGRNGAYDIYFNHSANFGFNWMEAGEARVDTGADDAHSGKPRMAVDGAGGVYVAWEDSRNGATDIYFNRSLDWGATWGLDQRVDLDDGAAPAASFVHSIAVEAGRVFVAWSDRRGGEGQDVYLAVSQDAGASFGSPVRLDVGDGPGVSDSLYPQVRASGDQVMVVWRDDRYGAFDVLLQRSEDGGASWLEEPVRVDPDPAGGAHSLDPILMVGVDGRVAVAYPDLRNGYDDLYFNRSTDGGATFSADDVRIDADTAGTAISENLQAQLSEGRLYFLWLDWRFGEADVLFRRLDLEG